VKISPIKVSSFTYPKQTTTKNGGFVTVIFRQGIRTASGVLNRRRGKVFSATLVNLLMSFVKKCVCCLNFSTNLSKPILRNEPNHLYTHPNKSSLH